jgi:hypothetical protein
VVEGSTLKDVIIGAGSQIRDCSLETSLIGDHVSVSGLTGRFNLGDDSRAEG